MKHRTAFQSFELDTAGEKITESYCSCKAGLGGHCSHIIGLLKTLQGFKLSNFTAIPDKVCCTSLPQVWGVAAVLRLTPYRSTILSWRNQWKTENADHLPATLILRKNKESEKNSNNCDPAAVWQHFSKPPATSGLATTV